MCGIAGFLNFSYSDDQFKCVLFRMAGTMVHRGRDSEGVWFDKEEGIGLAHRRLAVIDTSSEGHQPMMSHSGRYMIAYNGEVYNFELLRNSLRNERIKWRGHSDTEVILQAVEAWGLERALDSFIGMFAFALWDRKKGKNIAGFSSFLVSRQGGRIRTAPVVSKRYQKCSGPTGNTVKRSRENADDCILDERRTAPYNIRHPETSIQRHVLT